MNGPDSGYAWCVAFAACVINFIMAGLGRMSGILYVAFIDMFQIDRRAASVPFSIRSSARNLLGPAVGILGQKYSVRTVAITGGVIGTVSGACCFYADNMLWISILWGGINGVGTAMTTTLNQVVIGQYFKKYRTTAAGMGFSGGCVGSFIFPVLLEELLRNFGIQGTFLIMGGIIMHTIPAAMILRKPWWVKKRNREIRAKDNKELAGTQNTNNDEPANNKRQKVLSIKNEDNAESDIFSSDLPCLEESKAEQPDQIGNLKHKVDFEFLNQNIDIILNFMSISEALYINKSNDQIDGSRKAQVNNAFESDVVNHTFVPDEIKQLEMRNDIAFVLKTLNNCVTINGNASMESNEKINKTPFPPNSNRNVLCENIQTTSFSERSFSQKADETFSANKVKHYIMSKFQTLVNSDNSQILSHFSREKKEHLRKLLTEIKKLLVLNDEAEKRISRETSVNIRLSNENTVLDELTSNVDSSKNNNETSTSFSNLLKAALKLHTKPIFLLVCFCRCVHFITFVPVVAFIVDFTMDKGLKEEDGKYVIAALSLGDLLGRIGLGWLTDRGYIALPRYMLLVMFLQGGCTAVLPFATTKPVLFPLLSLFGLLQGSLFVRHPVLINKYIGGHEQSIAMGCMNFFAGLLGFALPSYIGYFRDNVGSYDGMFYINSIIGTIIGLLWIFEPYLVKFSTDKRNECAT